MNEADREVHVFRCKLATRKCQELNGPRKQPGRRMHGRNRKDGEKEQCIQATSHQLRCFVKGRHFAEGVQLYHQSTPTVRPLLQPSHSHNYRTSLKFSAVYYLELRWLLTSGLTSTYSRCCPCSNFLLFVVHANPYDERFGMLYKVLRSAGGFRRPLCSLTRKD